MLIATRIKHTNLRRERERERERELWDFKFRDLGERMRVPLGRVMRYIQNYILYFYKTATRPNKLISNFFFLLGNAKALVNTSFKEKIYGEKKQLIF